MIIASILIGLALLAVTLYFVFSPLQRRANVPLFTGQGLEIEQTPKRETLLAALRDLEFDHSTGKLTDEDYQAIRADLMRRTVAAPRTDEGNTMLDAQIEAAVLSYRRDKRSVNNCTACGAELTSGSRFCAACGAPVAVTYHCSHCGKSYSKGDAFCSLCGLSLHQVMEFAS
ncbi:MAG: zinc-ribbon domain-containing protein [Caldilineales bacterium]|nr:zinc-ribbon domain-containing protein [Caldilineales bacterium]